MSSVENVEEERLRRRRETRLRIAGIDRAMAHLREEQAKLAKLEETKQQADADHTAACEPLLAERAEIEARQNARVADRVQIDPNDEKRLEEIARLIEEKTDALNLGIAAIEVEQKRVKACLSDPNGQKLG